MKKSTVTLCRMSDHAYSCPNIHDFGHQLQEFVSSSVTQRKDMNVRMWTWVGLTSNQDVTPHNCFSAALTCPTITIS